MTPAQRQDFDENGFIILENFLTPEELSELLNAVDRVGARARSDRGLAPDSGFTVQNALAHDEAFLSLIDHPRMLPLVVDVMGWNIQIRVTHLNYRVPYPEGLRLGELGRGDGDDLKAGYDNVQWHADLMDSFEATSMDGVLPFLEVKAGYYLTDLTKHNSGALAVVPGSHRRRVQELRDLDFRVDPKEVFEVNVPAGSAILFRTSIWHCVTPNLSDHVRKVLYVGYNHRWIRPVDYVEQDPELVARSSPIRRQLLGTLATGNPSLGDNPWHPASRFYHVLNWDDVPLKEWMERHMAERTQGPKKAG
jgi:ectoine hydroxylase-related dioxygenase (phytanoyl-CoA dioxygenase family)